MKKFKNVGIGIFDVNNIEIKEGDKVKYKDRLYKGIEFEGVVVYNDIIAQFLIERGENGADGCASFGADRAFDVEIIGSNLSIEEKENEIAKILENNSHRVTIIINKLKELKKQLKELPDKTIADRVDVVKTECEIKGIETVLDTLGINVNTL